MTKKGIERAAHQAAERLTGERWCYAGHHTKSDMRMHRGRRYCVTCIARLSAQFKANRTKGKA